MIPTLLAALSLLDPSPAQAPRAHADAPTLQQIGAAAAVLTSVTVTLECTARATGTVEHCQVLGESHPGLGFGEAAVALMKDARVEASARDIQFAHTIEFMP